MNIKTYRPKSTAPVQALQLSVDTFRAALEWLTWDRLLTASWIHPELSFKVGDATWRAMRGDWIIRSADGEFTVKTATDFEAQFEEVAE